MPQRERHVLGSDLPTTHGVSETNSEGTSARTQQHFCTSSSAHQQRINHQQEVLTSTQRATSNAAAGHFPSRFVLFSRFEFQEGRAITIFDWQILQFEQMFGRRNPAVTQISFECSAIELPDPNSDPSAFICMYEARQKTLFLKRRACVWRACVQVSSPMHFCLYPLISFSLFLCI